ncbi:TIR domain-containing protein [Amycolatopsis sp. CA-128772]|uniref:tetratricopeptide repeat protein n=1 Tax=Amycolatopsis sp. CA-128772 TaxID=2073159 RepID=UPI000CCFEC17|nr:TIR domain-containing protein [Amycolatopsis sp. CA-128772]
MTGVPSGEQWYDVFLCYKSEDYTAAAALYKALKRRGKRVFLDVIDGPTWAPLTPSIEDALSRSRSLVALVTKNFPISPHCREELHFALSAAYRLDEGATSRVMAVVQGIPPDYVMPPQLTVYRLPHSNLPPDELVDSIVSNVDRHQGFFGDAPSVPSADWYPYEPSGPSFHGRYAELWRIHAGLRSREKNSDRSRPIFTVSGIGGQGKSTLCLEYARLFARDHPAGVFLFELGGSEGRGALGSQAPEARFRETMEKVTDYLVGLDQPYLWILDDVPTDVGRERLQQFLPPTRTGRVLVTTRAEFRTLSKRGFALDPLARENAVEVLTEYRPAAPDQQKAARGIVTLLDGHPLSLKLAAGLTTAPEFTGYPRLLADLSTPSSREPLEDSRLLADIPVGVGRPFSRILLRSFGSLNAAAQDVLCAASVLGSAPIPQDLLVKAVFYGAPARETGLAEGMRQASARGLLQAGDAGATMHRSIARAIRALVTPGKSRERFRNAALAALVSAVESTRDAYRHREVAAYLPHVRAVAGLLVGGDSWTVGSDELHLANEAGRTEIESGQTDEALRLYESASEACAVAGVDWFTRCVVDSGLAVALEAKSRFSEALSLKERVAELLESELGVGALETLIAQNNLGLALMKTGRDGEAHELLRSVYRRSRDGLGANHTATLRTLCNLAIARGHLAGPATEPDGHRRVAHRYWDAAWARWSKIAPPDEELHLMALNGLALSLRSLGNRDEALRLMSDLHRRRAQLLGTEHPATLDAWENELILREELNERSE